MANVAKGLPDTHNTVLYGGKILDRGMWHDFALKRGEGLDGAIRQIGRFEPEPSDAFRSVYGEPFGLAVEFSCILQTGESAKGSCSVRLMTGSRNWSALLVFPKT